MDHIFKRWLEAKLGFKNEYRPFTTLAYAQSLNGYLTGHSQKQTCFSSKPASILTHGLRSYHDAIMVGRQTFAIDNPELSVRLTDGCNPRRIVLDRLLKLPLSLKVFKDSGIKPIVFCNENADALKQEELQKLGVSVFTLKPSSQALDLAAILLTLKQLGIASLMLEGGPSLISSFMDLKLIDYGVITINPSLVSCIDGLSIQKKHDSSQKNQTKHFMPFIAKPTHTSLGSDLIVTGPMNYSPIPDDPILNYSHEALYEQASNSVV